MPFGPDVEYRHIHNQSGVSADKVIEEVVGWTLVELLTHRYEEYAEITVIRNPQTFHESVPPIRLN